MVLLVSVVDEPVNVENVKEGAHANEKLKNKERNFLNENSNNDVIHCMKMRLTDSIILEDFKQRFIFENKKNSFRTYL